MMDQNIISLLHTTDGKFYLTRDKLEQEIRDELAAHGGRLSLHELPALLNVDPAHIQAACQEVW